MSAQDGLMGAHRLTRDVPHGVLFPFLGGTVGMDQILGVLQFAVDGLSQRQQVTADNLANVDTPGYTAQEVGFESSLQQAMASPDGGQATVTVSADPTAPGTNGNNVDTGSQLVSAEQTTLQYQTMVEMLNAQYRLIQGAAGGSFQ